MQTCGIDVRCTACSAREMIVAAWRAPLRICVQNELRSKGQFLHRLIDLFELQKPHCHNQEHLAALQIILRKLQSLVEPMHGRMETLHAQQCLHVINQDTPSEQNSIATNGEVGPKCVELDQGAFAVQCSGHQPQVRS